MQALVDYRPALRARTGIGEYVHELARAVATTGAAAVTAFSASSRDRVTAEAVVDLAPARVIDRRIPVSALTWGWHHAGWPPIEWLAGHYDVVHSPTPLTVPARRAAQVVTVFDLYFLAPDAGALTAAQRDFAALARRHVVTADHVVTGSSYAAELVVRTFGVDPTRVTPTPLGAPRWADDVFTRRRGAAGGTILFIGTFEPRKNLGVLLDAYAKLRARRPDAPALVLAGAVPDSGRAWVERAMSPPLAPHVRVEGYVSDARRRELYAEARVVVLPSREEGFGLPALEALACGIPVVATPVGALPEVVGDAAMFAPYDDAEAWALALESCLDDARCRDLAARGRARAAHFTWAATAEATLVAYRAAVRQRAARA